MNDFFVLGLFENLKIEVYDEQLKLMFNDIDSDNSGSIDYNELTNYIRYAKME